MVAGTSVVEAGLSAGAIVASGAAVAAGLASGAAVSVFCSQAARSAALARMQMYLFIVIGCKGIVWYLLNRSKNAFRLF